MKRVIVRYQTHPERAEENAELIRAVFRALAASPPAGLAYRTYRLADRTTFLHVAEIDTPDGSNPLNGVAAFKAFTAGIADRCVVPPQGLDAELVGAFGTPAA